ncbi:carbohydrate kinase [Microbacterium panaciterrae]|uniref:Carbohydrate kinase n=1 Tax=Microbacterium panaciterrae TaxID=985759 RepID=A0ABP8PPG8_9MICO
MTGAGLAVVGESLVDVIIDPGGGRVVRPGGSPMNVAIAAARLGMRASLATAIGDDEHGALVREHIRRDGVTLIECGRQDRATNEAIASLAPDGSASYAFRLGNTVTDIDRALTTAGVDVDHIHTGSLTAATDAEWAEALAVVRAWRPRATVSYDPNCRPDIGVTRTEYRERVSAFVAEANIVKASDEDLSWLFPGEDHDAVAARWLAAGPQLVVITRGDAGPVGYGSGLRVARPASRVIVADTVGAGDSFMAAMLAWHDDHGLLGENARRQLDAEELGAMLDFASVAAAITCTRSGADSPRRDELRERGEAVQHAPGFAPHSAKA